jgi:hypothetical protein
VYIWTSVLAKERLDVDEVAVAGAMEEDNVRSLSASAEAAVDGNPSTAPACERDSFVGGGLVK